MPQQPPLFGEFDERNVPGQEGESDALNAATAGEQGIALPPLDRALKPSRTRPVKALPANPDHQRLAAALHPRIRLGGSTWSYPGWDGLVWDGAYSESKLAKDGLHAYAQHPLLRAVCIDRSFYKPLSAAEFQHDAAQVPDDFRFVVKAPSMVTDALVRDESGKGMKLNPAFLNAALAQQFFIDPALQGLGQRLGALVFQISPLPVAWLRRIPELLNRLHEFLRALPNTAALQSTAPDAKLAVEVRDPQWLVPELAQVLRDTGHTYCLGLHAKMPPIEDQLPMLRALWPGPLVARWNLNPLHGAYGYEAAQRDYSPYNRIVDPDPHTRSLLVKVVNATVAAGYPATITISNKAEGSAPLSVVGLAEELVRMRAPLA